MPPGDLDAIDRDRLYSFADAARLVPSCRAGRSVSVRTLHRWRGAGLLQCVPRVRGGRTFWFVWGAELLRVLAADTKPEWNGRTPGERDVAHKGAMDRLRERGYLPQEARK